MVARRGTTMLNLTAVIIRVAGNGNYTQASIYIATIPSALVITGVLIPVLKKAAM